MDSGLGQQALEVVVRCVFCVRVRNQFGLPASLCVLAGA